MARRKKIMKEKPEKKTKLPPEERAKKNLERKLKWVENPNAIVIIPFAKPNRNALTNMLMALDRFGARLRNWTGFGNDFGFDDAKVHIKKIDEFVDHLWKEMQAIAPWMLDSRKEEWKSLLRPYDENKLQAQRRTSYVFVPRSDASGQAGIAVKTIERQCFVLREIGTFDQLEKASTRYLKLCKEFDDFLTQLAKDCDIEYNSPYRKRGDEETEEKEEQPKSKTKA